MRRRAFLNGICLGGLAAWGLTDYFPGYSYEGTNLTEAAREALRRAVRFFDEVVSVEGGYVWAYSVDLKVREGEGKAGPQTAWVQPPGTPSVGLALLNAYRRTGEPLCLEAAKRAAHALVRGQLVSGGWDYRIEFDPPLRQRYRYRKPPAGGERANNNSTLDDDTTQSALRFLMEYDRQTQMKDADVHEAVQYGLQALLAVQRPNGGWPQRFAEPPNPAEYPDLPASYPSDWPRNWPALPYHDCYTLNDNAHVDTLRTLLLAWRIYGNDSYLQGAVRGGEFLMKAQMPDPQPAWAQQYDRRMQPCWARRFEPPAITGHESQGALRGLILLFHETGDRRFLEPIPRAIEYLKKSVLSDGNLARFYELKTNRPLYCTKAYKLTYSDADTPTHYGFKVRNELPAIEREYEEAVRGGPRSVLLRTEGLGPISSSLVASVKRAIDSLDSQGRWIEPGRLEEGSATGAPGKIITTRTFIRNIEALSRYIAAADARRR